MILICGCGAVPGTPIQQTAVLRVAASAVRAAGTTTAVSVFDWCVPPRRLLSPFVLLPLPSLLPPCSVKQTNFFGKKGCYAIAFPDL